MKKDNNNPPTPVLKKMKSYIYITTVKKTLLFAEKEKMLVQLNINFCDILFYHTRTKKKSHYYILTLVVHYCHHQHLDVVLFKLNNSRRYNLNPPNNKETQ